MTFSNVLSGILFFSAFQQLLFALNGSQSPELIMSITLAVLIANDVIYISHKVEGEKSVDYTWKFMLIDLATFVILSLAILVLGGHDSTKNMFQIKLKSPLGEYFSHTNFWWALAAYWSLIMLWTGLARIHKTYPWPLYIMSWLVAIAFTIQAILTSTVSQSISDYSGLGALAYLVIFLAYRPLSKRLPDAEIRKPLPPPVAGQTTVRLVIEGVGGFEGPIPRV